MITTITTTATNTPTLELLSLDEAILVSEGEIKKEVMSVAVAVVSADVTIYVLAVMMDVLVAVMMDVLVGVIEVETALAIN